MIAAAHISKRFGIIEAVKDVSVTIKKGEVFGLIGTNGAGKSTFLRMACGILKPDSGSILIDEKSVYENPAAKSEIFLYQMISIFCLMQILWIWHNFIEIITVVLIWRGFWK